MCIKTKLASTSFKLIFLYSVFLYSGFYIFNNSQNDSNNNLAFAQLQTEFSISLEHLINENSPILGDDDAPVTIFDFSDFQCPMCARYSKNIEPSIIADYVNTGKVKLVYKHFAIFGQDSINAAKVSQCVNEQGKFGEFKKILYDNQKGANTGWASKENLINFASQIPEINLESLNSCVNSTRYDSMINTDLLQAMAYNFAGTPAFIVVKSDGSNPEVIGGAYPYPLFRSIIEKKLGGG